MRYQALHIYCLFLTPECVNRNEFRAEEIQGISVGPVIGDDLKLMQTVARNERAPSLSLARALSHFLSHSLGKYLWFQVTCIESSVYLLRCRCSKTAAAICLLKSAINYQTDRP